MNHKHPLRRPIWSKTKGIILDYFTFLAFLLFLLINITIGRGLHHIDRKFKTRYLERLTRWFEILA